MMNEIIQQKIRGINDALTQYLSNRNDKNFTVFLKLFSEYFDSSFFNKDDIANEEYNILSHVMNHGLLMIMDKTNKHQHPISYPFVRITKLRSKLYFEFSNMFISKLDELNEKTQRSVVDLIRRIYNEFYIINEQLPFIQYLVHRHQFRYDNNNYIHTFLADFSKIIPTNQMLNVYDEVEKMFGGFNDISIKKEIAIYKEAILAKRDYDVIQEGFNIGKIKAAIAILKLISHTPNKNKMFYDLGLHRSCSDILHPHTLYYEYKGTRVELLTYIKEFSNVDLVKTIKNKKFDELAILLPYLPQGFVDKYFNDCVDKSDLRMVKTFLDAGAYYFAPKIDDEDDDGLNNDKRDIDKTHFTRELLSKTKLE